MRKTIRYLAAALSAAIGLSLAGLFVSSLASAANGPRFTYGARAVSPLAAVHTATTAVQLRPDSGNHGNWALDDMTRTIVLTRHAEVPAPDCGTTATACFYYTYVITDKGSFQVPSGGLSPQAGTAEDVTERGTLSGGVQFGYLFSSWKRAYVSGVPVTENDNGIVPSGLHTTSEWADQFFGPSARFGGSSLVNWSWSYTVAKGADSQCPAGTWKWVDASSNSDGSLPADGDILAPGKADCAVQG